MGVELSSRLLVVRSSSDKIDLEEGGLAAAVGAEEHPELPRRDA